MLFSFTIEVVVVKGFIKVDVSVGVNSVVVTVEFVTPLTVVYSVEVTDVDVKSTELVSWLVLDRGNDTSVGTVDSLVLKEGLVVCVIKFIVDPIVVDRVPSIVVDGWLKESFDETCIVEPFVLSVADDVVEDLDSRAASNVDWFIVVASVE